MMFDKVMQVNFLSRQGLAFLFFYHGLFPKIFFPSPIEQQLVALHGLNDSSMTLSQVAGILEVLLAALIILLRSSLIPIYLASLALIVLVIDVAIVMPGLLVEAFNPITTNFMGLLLCYLIWLSHPARIEKSL